MASLRRRKSGERVFGILMLLLALFLLWQAYDISGFGGLSTPGAFPLAASFAMVVACVSVVITDSRRPPEVEGRLSEQIRSFSTFIAPSVVVIFAGFVVGYAALLDTLGFLPASFLFLFVAIQFLHRGTARFSALIALFSLIVVYGLFRQIFQVVLPEGIVPEREIMAWIGNFFSSGEAK